MLFKNPRDGPSEFNDKLSNNDGPCSYEHDSNDEDKDSDLLDSNYGGCRFVKAPVEAPVSFKLDSIEKLLLKTLKEEMRVISENILRMIDCEDSRLTTFSRETYKHVVLVLFYLCRVNMSASGKQSRIGLFKMPL